MQAMWAAPLCQTFLHLLYDKEILEEPIILQWYSRKHVGGEDGGLEPQRKQLREQVRHSCHVISYVCMSLRQIDREIAFPPFWLRFFLRKPQCIGMTIHFVSVGIIPTLFCGTKPSAPKLLSFICQSRSPYVGFINDCHFSGSVVASVVFFPFD